MPIANSSQLNQPTKPPLPTPIFHLIMSQAHILRLSQEIIDEIIDYFHPERDLRTLTALSATCRAVVPRCQMLMFSTIKFSSDSRKAQQGARRQRIQEFHDILNTSPYIAGYVRGLQLTIASFDNDWVAEDAQFLKVMEFIRRSGSYIRSLAIHGWSFPEKFSDARSLEQNFLRPFITPYITSLKISGMMSIPITLLASSVNLKWLSINYSDLEPFGDDLDINAFQFCPKIQHLEFDPPTGVIDAVLNAGCDPSFPLIADLSYLRTLRTLAHHHNVEAAQKIIEISANSLEELFLLADGDSQNYYAYAGSIDFSLAACLRVLHFDVLFPVRSGTQDPLADLCSVLKTISTPNTLRKIYLSAYIGFCSSVGGPESCFLAAWELLDCEIPRISSGNPLEFYLHMVYQVPESDDDEESDHGNSGDVGEVRNYCETTFQRLVREKLPKIHDAPQITLTLSHSLDLSDF